MECHKIAEFLVPSINSITSKDTFCFAKEIVDQDIYFGMDSLDVDSLFTNISLDKTIDICTNTIYSQQGVVESINNFEIFHY